MNRILITLSLTFFSAVMTQAQSDLVATDLPLISVQPLQMIPVPGKPAQPESQWAPPNVPIPVLPGIQDGPLPCPAGIGKPCPLLGGRLYFSDPVHMTEHDLTWGKAMRNPGMVFGILANLASTIADIEGTEACLHVHTCREGNPLFGAHPGRGKAYGIGMPLNFATYAMAGWLKKKGDGNIAFGLLWGGTMVHTYEAARGFTLANKSSSVKTNSFTGQTLGITVKF
jgi:hypothetical protein